MSEVSAMSEVVELAERLGKYFALKLIRDFLAVVQDKLQKEFGVKTADVYVIDAKLLAMKYDLRAELERLGLSQDKIARILGDEA